LGLFTHRSKTIFGVTLLVPFICREHRGFTITGERHDHFVACKDSPTISIKTTALLSAHIQTVELVVVVVEYLSSSCDSILALVEAWVRVPSINCLLAGNTDGPCGKVLNESSRVRIVHHCHGTKRVSESCNQLVYIL
jgi:hypothetical protein